MSDPARRRAALALVLLLAGGSLAGCRQVSSAWGCARESVSAALPRSDCPDARGYVYADPVYGTTGQVDPGLGSGGTGAFQRP